MYQEAPYPGPTPPYAYGQGYGGYAPPQQQPLYDNKTPFDNGRFKPKKKINDPIFLILFVLQVRRLFFHRRVDYNLLQFQLLGFAALSGIAISSWVSDGGLGGGLGKPGGKTGTAVSLNQFVYDALPAWLIFHEQKSNPGVLCIYFSWSQQQQFCFLPAI